jgi:cell division septal protein FtsQ
LERIEVEGTSKTTPEAIRARLSRFMGRNLLDLALADVVETAGTDPWVRDVSAKRILPHGLRLKVTERRPAAIAVLDSVAHVIDEEGFDIGPCGEDLAYDLPVLTGLDSLEKGARPEALSRGATLVRRLRAVRNAWASGISEVDVARPDRVAIVTAAPGPRLLLDPERIERNLDDYLALRRRIEEKVGPAEYVDLRWSHRISVLPSDDTLSTGSH